MIKTSKVAAETRNKI